jgi:hypothetical protein
VAQAQCSGLLSWRAVRESVGLALVKIPRWALATDGGQVAPARAMLLRDVQLVLRREQREFVTADAEDGFDSVVAQPQRNDLSTRV